MTQSVFATLAPHFAPSPAPVAQWIEQRFPKPQVACSIHAGGAAEILVNTGVSAYLQAFIALFCICRIYGVSRLVPKFHGTGAGWNRSKAVASNAA